MARALLQYREDIDSAVRMLDLALQLATSFDAQAVMLRMACAIIQQDEVTVGELHAMAADAVGAQQASDLLKQAAQCLLPESPAPVGQPDDIADQSERPVGEPSPAVGQSERAADEPDQIADEPLSERRPP